jgi:DNA polymerase
LSTETQISPPGPELNFRLSEQNTPNAASATVYSPEPLEQSQPQQTGAAERLAAIEPLCQKALSCRDCDLCQKRRQVVFGEGSLDARILFICEAPGREEDLQGRPFVGPAGGLLTEVIEKGMKISRGETYLTTIVKCRPPGNRELHPQEIECCSHYLKQQLAIIEPEVIIAVGGVAAGILTSQSCSIEHLRGVWHEYEGLPLMPVYHTSFLLRQRRHNGGNRTQYDRILWQDIKLVMNRLRMEAR